MDNPSLRLYLLFLFSEAEKMQVINSGDYRAFLSDRLDELEEITSIKIERTTNETLAN